MRGWLMAGYAAAAAALAMGLGPGVPACAVETDAARPLYLQTIPGYEITYFARNIPGVRMLRFTPSGSLIVTVPYRGQVLLLKPDAQGAAARPFVLLEGLNNPHGVDLRDGALYVAEEDAVGRIAYNDQKGAPEGDYTRIITGLPQDGGHSTRTVRAGPDGKLYVTAGSSCNICEEENPQRAAMLRYDLDGANGEIYARGLRNSVGFDWRPEDGALYATDNGRDWLGDDLPPCELNRIEQGKHYGWPYAYGRNIPDPQYGPGAEEKIAAAVAPVFEFRAHNAPLGITFIRNLDAPAPLRGGALVALHGSWNRSVKDGYKIVLLNWRTGGKIEASDFVWGFLENGKVHGRPVDIAEGPDGAYYISDDAAGNIYRAARKAN